MWTCTKWLKIPNQNQAKSIFIVYTLKQSKRQGRGRRNRGHSRGILKIHKREGCQWHPLQLSSHPTSSAGERSHNHKQAHLPEFLAIGRKEKKRHVHINKCRRLTFFILYLLINHKIIKFVTTELLYLQMYFHLQFKPYLDLILWCSMNTSRGVWDWLRIMCP